MNNKEIVKELLIKKYPNEVEFINSEEYGLIKDFLLEQKTVYEGGYYSHRHYQTYDRVVELDGRFFAFEDYNITGDMGMWEMGLEYDDNSIREVFKKEITTFIYE